MENIIKGISLKAAFDAQVTAALMIQTNALIPIKLASTALRYIQTGNQQACSQRHVSQTT